MENNKSAMCYIISTYDDVWGDTYVYYNGDIIDESRKMFGESRIDEFFYYDNVIRSIKISFRLKVKMKCISSDFELSKRIDGKGYVVYTIGCRNKNYNVSFRLKIRKL